MNHSNHSLRDPAIQKAFDMLERSIHRESIRNSEGALTRNTRNNTDISQISIESSTCLQVTSDDVGGDITGEMVGKFWFITDYSRTDLGDAGDVVRP